MDERDRTLSDLVGLLKSWIPWRSEPAHVSRDFWMPDQSCRVCYECDSHFTLFNRRHHCRLCGRIFCAKCTSNWVSTERKASPEAWEKIRVCNYCFKQWEKDLTVSVDNGIKAANLEISSISASETSYLSTKSSGICSSNITFYSLPQSAGMETTVERQSVEATNDHLGDIGDQNLSQDQFEFFQNSFYFEENKWGNTASSENQILEFSNLLQQLKGRPLVYSPMVGSIEENVDIESDEETPFSASQTTNKMQSLGCESSNILLNRRFSVSWVLGKVHHISILRSIYIVLIKAKINVLLPFGPIAIILHYLTKQHGWIFFFSLLGITPLAERLGYATEQLAFFTGPTVGGLLNATFGNATEMIISMYALKNGMIRVVQQSLLGSILSNMLLVLGCAFFCGGIVHHQKVQIFNKSTALVNSGLLLMAVMGILFPAVLHFTHSELHKGKSEIALSRVSSCIMLVAYASYLFFQLRSQKNLYSSLDEANENNDEGTDGDEVPEITHCEAIVWLSILTLWISIISGYLVDAIQGASDSMNMPVSFISVILLPIVGNAAEHASAIMFAMKDKLDISLGVAIGSSTQISMFVIPFCVIVGWFMGKPMDLNFQLFETATLFITVLVVAFMLQEGQSNYFKGLMLILCYLIVAASFFVHIDPSNDDD